MITVNNLKGTIKEKETELTNPKRIMFYHDNTGPHDPLAT